jgi:hypothetical protein
MPLDLRAPCHFTCADTPLPLQAPPSRRNDSGGKPRHGVRESASSGATRDHHRAATRVPRSGYGQAPWRLTNVASSLTTIPRSANGAGPSHCASLGLDVRVGDGSAHAGRLNRDRELVSGSGSQTRPSRRVPPERAGVGMLLAACDGPRRAERQQRPRRAERQQRHRVIEDVLVDRASALRGLGPASSTSRSSSSPTARRPTSSSSRSSTIRAAYCCPRDIHWPRDDRSRSPTSAVRPGSAPITALPTASPNTCSTEPASGRRSSTPAMATNRSKPRRSSPPRQGITLAHRLNVLLNPEQVTALPLAGDMPVRHVQLAIMRNQRAPAGRAVVDTLR